MPTRLRPIKLRGHHLAVIEDYLALRDMEKNYPKSQDLAPFREHMQKYERIYRGSAMKKSEAIANEVLENPARRIEIVQGQDDVCADCRFLDECARGDYGEIRDAHKKEGIELQHSEERDKADDEELAKRALKKGKKYQAYKIFTELKSER